MNSTSKILIVVIIIETLLIGWLLYDKFQQQKVNKEIGHELVQVKSRSEEHTSELQSH